MLRNVIQDEMRLKNYAREIQIDFKNIYEGRAWKD
jgi:hypothetical protein